MVNASATKDEKFNDSYELLMSSFRVDDKVKKLLKEKAFIVQNPEIILNLARLLLLVDVIEIVDNEIVARKVVSRIEEPKIPVDDVIYKYLLKLKHDTLSGADISKLSELQQFPSYLNLYTLLSKAIDQKVKIQKIANDSDLKMSLIDLEVFLSNG